MQGIKPFLPKEGCVPIFVESRLWFDWLWEFLVKAIPQMQDTAAVLSQLIYRKQSKAAWPYITRGAQIASTHAEIQYLGYPFSIFWKLSDAEHSKPLSP
jgi:hydroxymethylglutaryl-CoA lyase